MLLKHFTDMIIFTNLVISYSLVCILTTPFMVFSVTCVIVSFTLFEAYARLH